MRKASSPPHKWRIVFFFFTVLLVVAADQVSKIWIKSHLALGQSLPETGWVRLTHVRNSGAAFGLFQGQSSLLTIIAILSVGILLLLALLIFHRVRFLDNTLIQITLGLLLGGTIGNLIDRLRFGYITDFIDFGFWPAFNVADSAIVVGVIIFAYSFLFLTREHQTSHR